MDKQQLWAIYNEIYTNWKGYIITVARSNRIDPEDLYDAVLNYLIDYKVKDLKQLISKKAYELKYRKEKPFSKFQTKDDEKGSILDFFQYRNYDEPKEQRDARLDKLPEDLKEYLLSRIRIEKTLPIQERIRFRQKLKEAKKYLGG